MRHTLSQISPVARYYGVNASGEAVIEAATQKAAFDRETLFRA